MSKAQLEAFFDAIKSEARGYTWEQAHQQALPQGLYIHIPFCEKRCFYCDFYTMVKEQDSSLSRDYVAALIRHLHELHTLGLTDGLSTAYIGGGTPSMLGDESFYNLSSTIAKLANLSEFSSEMNPESTRASLMRQAKLAGLTRISFGVQSFSDAELKALGRIHTAERAIEAIGLAQEYGFNTSIDLMCAIPEQSDDTWESSLKTAVSLGVDHMSIYPLQIEEHTVFARYSDDEDWHTDIVQARRMSQARAILEASEYKPYEVASYAKPHKSCAHNRLYWTGYPYLALGSNGAGMLSRAQYTLLKEALPNIEDLNNDAYRIRYKIVSSTRTYAHAQSLADLDFEFEFLTREEAAAEDLMLGFRLSAGPDSACIAHACEVFDEDKIYSCFEMLYDKELIRLTDDGARLCPTEQGWLMGNALYEEIWDLA